MKWKTCSSGIKATLIIYFVLLALLSICTFAIPFNKVDWSIVILTYICSMVMIIVECSLIITLLFKEENMNQKILGLPIVYYGLIVLIIQLIATIASYIVNAFIQVPLWIAIIVECILYAILAIQIAKGFFFKARNQEYHQTIANTSWMDNYRVEIKTLCLTNKVDVLKDKLNDLYESLRCSDPITNCKTEGIEIEMTSLLDALKEDIKNSKIDDADSKIIEIKDKLIKRNNLCKLGK